MTVKAWNEAVAMAKLPTTAAIAKVFEVWEGEFRAHPDRFMTADEIAAAEVLPLSEQRAVYFEAIFKTLPMANSGNPSPPPADVGGLPKKGL